MEEGWGVWGGGGGGKSFMRPAQVFSITDVEGNSFQLNHRGTTLAGYWRPGGKDMREKFWYNGILVKAWEIIFPSGKKREIVAVQ